MMKGLGWFFGSIIAVWTAIAIVVGWIVLVNYLMGTPFTIPSNEDLVPLIIISPWFGVCGLAFYDVGRRKR